MSKILTIAIPSYNVSQYQEKVLPTYCDPRLEQDLEVIIVDDGSTDSTLDTANRFQSEYPQIFRVIHQENGGHGAAVNTGLANATGKYFRVVDGDDWIDADALCAELEMMKCLNVDFICDVKQEVHMITGEKTLFPFPDTIECDKVLQFADVCAQGDAEPHLMIHNLSFDANYLRATGLSLLRHTFYEDWEYVVKGCVTAKTCAFVNQNVYQYMVGNANQSVSAANFAKRWDHHTRVLETMLAFAQTHREAATLKPEMQSYLDKKLDLLINTHYNIALIYDEDRKRGMKRARTFRKWLRENYPQFSKNADKRYRMGLALHVAGVDATKLDKIMRRNVRQA